MVNFSSEISPVYGFKTQLHFGSNLIKSDPILCLIPNLIEIRASLAGLNSLNVVLFKMLAAQFLIQMRIRSSSPLASGNAPNAA